ncbi:hypothetical protein HaLaN_16514 [Haematococcus lacustris]|uniref:Uncharacterized protein n=1 Tax=Haematococcus lacustris TaxID=44745 RepID=A0A699ZUD8_HAELA|nr:hypothetical protein HaLaN_16514 [Haematococcus lacustris]
MGTGCRLCSKLQPLTLERGLQPLLAARLLKGHQGPRGA